MITAAPKYIPLEHFACFITVKNGVIFEAPKGSDGQPDLSLEEEVKAPSEHFLKEVNEKLDTAFTLADFCGTK